jgi:hypothetical protein
LGVAAVGVFYGKAEPWDTAIALKHEGSAGVVGDRYDSHDRFSSEVHFACEAQ